MNGCQLLGLTYQTARTTKKRMTAILMMTMIRLTRALSLIPRTRRTQRRAMIAMAGRLTTAPVETNRWSVSLQSMRSVRHGHRQSAPPRTEQIVEEVDEVGRPADRDEAGRDHILEDEVPADDPGGELAHRSVAVRVCRPGDGDHGGQLCVAKGRAGGGDAGDREGEDDSRSGMPGGLDSRQNEDAHADDAADPQGDQVPNPQGLLQGPPFFGGRGEKLAEGFRSKQAVSHRHPPVGQRYIIKNGVRPASWRDRPVL